MSYSNKHLVEVNCSFQFKEETASWDSTYFGQFYEKIKDKGFNKREERKGVQITFNGQLASTGQSPVTTSQIEDQVVFRNEDSGQAIIIGKGKISFHYLKNYLGWTRFVNDFIIPYSDIYKSLGLGNGTRECSIVYLNRFIKDTTTDLSEYFTIISHINSGFGKEVVTSVQRVLSNNNNLLIAKLNSQIIGDMQNINLECGAVCINEQSMKGNDWASQANFTHEPILNFFETIINRKLKDEL